MAELKAGPELDRKVFEVIAPPGLLDTGSGLEFMQPYSTDLNAAFAAAEMVGLWKGRWLGSNENGWHLVGQFEVIHEKEHHPTPPLAICAAILKLKGPSDDGQSADSRQTDAPPAPDA